MYMQAKTKVMFYRVWDTPDAEKFILTMPQIGDAVDMDGTSKLLCITFCIPMATSVRSFHTLLGTVAHSPKRVTDTDIGEES